MCMQVRERRRCAKEFLPRRTLPRTLRLHSITMESMRPVLSTLRLSAPRRAYRPLYQCLHTSAAHRATPLPHLSVPGPPPATPAAYPSDASERVARKRRQADLMKQAQEIRSTYTPTTKPKHMLKKRFWTDVIVKEADGGHCLLGYIDQAHLL